MVETVLLIDDDKATRYINSRIIAKHAKFKNILSFSGGEVALEYLRSASVNFIPKPQLILLDLNMPCMNGWEFLEEYKLLDSSMIQHSRLVILSTSNDPRDIEKSKNAETVYGFINKPLTKLVLDKILQTCFINMIKRYNNLIINKLWCKN